MTTMTMTKDHMLLNEQEVMELEKSYWDALKQRDARTAGRLTAEDSTIVGASGVSGISSQQIGKLVDEAPYTIRDYRIDPGSTRINRLCDDAFAVSYKVTEDLEVDGKPIRLQAFDSSVWKKEATGWTCVLHTESIAGDAFGRDRKPGGQFS